MKYRLAVFDLDGTILDTLQDLYNSVNAALEKNRYPARSLEEVRAFVGNGVPKLIDRACPLDCPDARKNQVYADFTAHYAVHCADTTRPYPGIPALLNALKAEGMLLAVVSNKDDYAVQSLCRDYFPGVFHAAVGACAEVRKKPAPDTVNAVLKQLQVSPIDAVYIGDTNVDLETAQNADMDCIAVTWGFRSVNHLLENGAKVLVNSAEELKKALLA